MDTYFKGLTKKHYSHIFAIAKTNNHIKLFQ